MIMNKYIYLSVAALIILIGIAMAASNSQANIWWGKSKLIETLTQGESKTIEVVFTSQDDLGEVTLSISDDLANFVVGFEPEKITVTKNQPYKFDLILKAPLDIPLGTYGGTIHLRQGAKTIAKPLPVNLIIQEKQELPPAPVSFEWETPINISNLPSTSYRPKTIVDSLGNVYVFWLHSDFNSQYNIYYAKLENGIWSAPQRIVANDNYHTIYDFDVDIDNQNHIFLAFTQYLSGTGYAVYYMSYDGNNWSLPTKLADGSYPSLAIDSNNKVHLVYSSANDIYYTVFNGTSWSTPYNISNDGNLYEDNTNGIKTIRVDANNNIHVAWSKWNYGIMYTKFDGTSWATPQLLSRLSSWPDTAYWLSLGANGVVAVGYTQGPNNCVDQEIYLALSTDNGNSWPTAELISNDDNIGSRWPSISVVSPTNIQIIWSECANSVPFRFYNGNNWSDIIDISNGSLRAETPNLYIRNGISYAVWSSNNSIYFSKTK